MNPARQDSSFRAPTARRDRRYRGSPTDNYAVLVDGELRAGSQLLTEQVTINGTTFDYQVDANGFWQVHRQAPIALGTHVINLVNGQLQSAGRTP